jgi:hypothetical protein
MFGADHGLVVSQLLVTSGPIMYLIMEDQFLSRCRTAQPPASEFEDAEPRQRRHD